MLGAEAVAPPLERPVAGQQLVEDEADGVDVAAGVDPRRVAHDLLGAHVLGRAQQVALLGQVLVAVAPLDLQELGDAEVEDLQHLLTGRPAVDEHQVGRLEVAVDDPVLVGHLEDVAELVEDPRRPVERHRDAGLQDRLEAPAPDVIHLDEGDGAVRPGVGVVDRDGVGMGEAGHGPRLAAEPGPHLRVERDAGDDQLQRPLHVQLGMPDPPDRPHAPLA